MADETDSFEVYQDAKGEWRWRRKSPNGTIVAAASEGYGSKAAAEANMTRKAAPSDTWDFYQDAGGKWRWRQTAQNGQIVGASSQGYASEADARANAARLGWTA